MKIAVCVKPVPDMAEISVNQNNLPVRDGLQNKPGLPFKVNPADESALEAALRLRGNGEITLVCMGSKSMSHIQKSLLVHGVDKAVLINDNAMAGSDTYATAKTLCAALVYLGGFDLVFCGRRAIDGETGQVPAELAFFLGIPFVTNVTRLELCHEDRLNETNLNCERLLETGTESLEVTLPALVSFCEYSYPLRPPGIASMRKAIGKELIVLDRKMLGLQADECGNAGSPTRVRQITGNETPARSGICETDIYAGAKKLAAMTFMSRCAGKTGTCCHQSGSGFPLNE